MISISHWGMYEFVAFPGFRVPPYGYKFADHNISEWQRPDGIIELEPIKVDEDIPDFKAMAKSWVNWATSNRKREQIRLLYRAGYLSVVEREQAERALA